MIIYNALTDMHIRLNNLLDEFSHCNSATLSTLVLTYCMIVKRGDIMATIWIHFIHLLYTFYTWRKAIRRVWIISYITHTSILISLI